MVLSFYFCQITHLGGVQRCCLQSIVWEGEEGLHEYQECIGMKSLPLLGLGGSKSRGALFPAFPALDF